MMPVSARYLASLHLARYVTRVEWSNDAGQTWHPATYLDGGDPVADANSQVRWAISDMVLADVPVGRDGISPFGTRLRVWSGMVIDVDEVEWVPLGIYRVKNVERSGVIRDGAPSSVTVSGQSLESVVIDDRFPVPRQYRPQPGHYLIDTLIRESVPDASVQWRLDDDDTLPKLVAERDRWALIDGDRSAKSIARSLGARVYCDGRGVFVVAPTPSLEDPPVWTLDVGEDGMLVEPAESLSDEGVYNQVVATGATTDTDDAGKPIPPVGPAIVADTDPTSPTRVDGPFGRKTRFYSSPLLRIQSQCERAAASILAQNLGLRQSVTLQAAVNFALEVGDVIHARMPDGSLEAHVVDSITYPLTGGAMSLSTRATATRFAGQPADAPEDTGDIDESTDEDAT